MKCLINFIAVFGIILATHATLSAQNVWKGGTPGQEQEWNNPKNWSQNRIPGIDDMVLIPNTESRGGFYPVVNGEAGPIYYLEVQGGATLSINQNGRLTIDGMGKYEDAILLIGTIVNHGEIQISADKGQMVAGHPESLLNAGQISVASPRANKY